ncbi:MAG TPA: DUF5681 domain-containing protein [Cyclobacteriaceae bacterium]|nr:DUF5681 domain-containing protein [Cyclobacteriaceae bacterium]
MPKQIAGAHGRGTLNMWEKGDPSPNPYGRPKKFVSTLRGYGYKVSEINDTIQALIAFTCEDLEEINDHPETTVLEKIVCKALIKAAKKGNLGTIETLLTRVFGRPGESKEDASNAKLDELRNLTREERFARIRFLIDSAENRPDAGGDAGGAIVPPDDTESGKPNAA